MDNTQKIRDYLGTNTEESNQSQLLSQQSQTSPLQSSPEIMPEIPPPPPTPTPKINNSPQPFNEPKKKKHWFRWGCLSILLLLLFFLFGLPALSNWKKDRLFISEEETVVSSQELIESDFFRKKITADEYVRQLTYLAFDNEKLSEGYRTSPVSTPPDIFSVVEAHKSEVSNETLQEVAGYIYSRDFSTEAVKTYDQRGELLEDKGANLPGNRAYAGLKDNIEARLLDERIYTDSGKFVIWFTQNGTDKVKKKDALKIARDVDAAYSEYVSSFSLSSEIDFYYPEIVLGDQRGKVPVYLTNDDSDQNSAFYVTSILPYVIRDIHPKAIGHNIFPYVVVQPKEAANYNDLKSLISHEVVHLAQDAGCNWKFACKYNPSLASKFTSETVANWAAANFYPESSLFREWFLNKYFANGPHVGTSLPVDIQNGYATYSYLKNIEQYLSKKQIFNSYKETDPVKYFSDLMGGIEKSIISQGSSNILNNYQEDAFNARVLPTEKTGTDLGIEQYLEPLSNNYQYLKLSELEGDVSINPKTSAGINLDIYGRKNGLSRFFSSSPKGFTKITSLKISSKVILKKEDFKGYNEAVLIFSNGNRESGYFYTVNIEGDSLSDVIPVENSIGVKECSNIYFSSLFEAIAQLSENFAKMSEEFSSMYAPGTEGQLTLKKSAEDLYQTADETRQEAKNYSGQGVLLCATKLKGEVHNQAFHEKIIDSYEGAKISHARFANLDDTGTEKISVASYLKFGDAPRFVFVITGGKEPGVLEAEFINIK